VCDTWASERGSGWLLSCDGRWRGRWDAEDRPVLSKKIRIRKLQDLKGLKALQSHWLGMEEVQLRCMK